MFLVLYLDMVQQMPYSLWDSCRGNVSQKKYKNQYLAFVDMQKAFDRVPHQVLCWVMRKLGIDKLIIQIFQAMYCEVRSNVHVENCFSDRLSVNIVVHQDSDLSPLLFIIVLEARSPEFRTGCLWMRIVVCSLVIIPEEELWRTLSKVNKLYKKVSARKVNLEKNGLRVNMNKTEVMFGGASMVL